MTDEEKEIDKVENSILSDADSSSFKDVFVRHIVTCDEDKAHVRFEGEVNTFFRFSLAQAKKSFKQNWKWSGNRSKTLTVVSWLF